MTSAIVRIGCTVDRSPLRSARIWKATAAASTTSASRNSGFAIIRSIVGCARPPNTGLTGRFALRCLRTVEIAAQVVDASASTMTAATNPPSDVQLVPR